MRGRIYDPEPRQAARRHWADTLVPRVMTDEVRVLMPLLSRHDGLVLVDVGAGKGCWTKAFLNVFGPRVARAFAVDPSPENHHELTLRADSLLFEPADHARVSAHRVALGAAAGEAVLHADEDGSPLGSLYPHEAIGRHGLLVLPDVAGPRQVVLDKRIATAVVPLDDFCRDHAIDHVDVLRIDAVGAEFDVLAGAEASLAAGRIDCVMFQFGSHQVEARRFFLDFHRLFERHGYDLYRIVDGTRRRLGQYEFFYEEFTQVATYAARRRAAPAGRPSAAFVEADYLAANPDVAAAVMAGAFASGAEHWLEYGEFERRRLRP